MFGAIACSSIGVDLGLVISTMMKTLMPASSITVSMRSFCGGGKSKTIGMGYHCFSASAMVVSTLFRCVKPRAAAPIRVPLPR
jgi:hypothetical protein